MIRIFKRNKEVAFYSNVIFNLEESEDMHHILAQSKIDKKTAENMEGAMQVLYEKGVATVIDWIEEGEYISHDDVRFINQPVSFKDYPLNDYKALVHDKHGIHKFGGIPPSDFIIPNNEIQAPIIYLGHLLCAKEASLKWTKSNSFHIICPIHLNFDVLYFDYSNPLAPVLLNIDEVKNCTNDYDLTNKDEIIFSELPVSFEDLTLDRYYEGIVIGNSGAPSWIQNEIIPKCPLSGSIMKFLLAIEPTNLLQVESTSKVYSDERFNEYMNSMQFWDSGVLYIFYEPQSKVAAYLMQNT